MASGSRLTKFQDLGLEGFWIHGVDGLSGLGYGGNGIGFRSSILPVV